MAATLRTTRSTTTESTFPNPTASTTSTSPDSEPEQHSSPPRPHRQLPSRLNLSPTVDPTLQHGGNRSLSSISLHAFVLGLVLSSSLLLTIYLLHISSPLWRLPQFISFLCVFHFLEFYTTARFNTSSAKVSSYLLFSNGLAYNVAHGAAMLEITLTSVLFPGWQARWTFGYGVGLGLACVLVGQVVRSTAMAQAGTNFNHIPAREKKEGHVLVTTGVYAWLRHPSYFGFFWWAIGTQIVVGNKVCLIAYTVVLWRFFASRIVQEEGFLVEFFGEDYLRFRKTTGTGIPFIR